MEYRRRQPEEEIDPLKWQISKLETLLSSVQLAENQVSTSADKTIEDINTAFDSLSAALVSAIEQRKQALTTEVLNAKEEGILSLKPYRDDIKSKLELQKSSFEEGDNNSSLLERGSKKQVGFAASSIQCKSLPRIPRREEIPHISAQLPGRGLRARLCSEIMSAGKISQRGPVQLTEVEEKPGALLLRWEEVESDRPVDVCQFRLQKTHGDLTAEPQLEANFHDVYRGAEPSFLVKELVPGNPYTFRVCCRAEGDQEWSAWSLPQVAVTNQQPFCWEQSNNNYQVTNENKIATKTTAEPSILFSKGGQFGPGHSIEFTILETKECVSDEGLGLAVQRIQGDSLVQPGVLFLNAQGCIFVDGSAKTTRLPALTKGSKVSFTCERIREDRLRVHIDNDNKTVTYDWRVGDQPLHFALAFGQVGWKVLVE